MVVSVVCVSDRCSRGETEDKSGKLIIELMSDIATIREYLVVPDEIEDISKTLIYLSDDMESDIIFTTGGTGFAPRDITPEATRKVIQKEAMGISEAIRVKSFERTPMSMFSRSISGIRGKTLIINLPGSPNAVKEAIDIIKPYLYHAVDTLSGNTQNCGGNY